jgi:type IV secretion system protein VirB4
MMHLAEYSKRPALLADWLPWAGLVAPGVILNKDGSFQRTARFRGPDLDSATQGELVATSARLNNALRRLGSGWALFVEAERREAANYPESVFPEPLSWLVDEERRAAFEEAESHFDSAYHLTLLYLPPEESTARAAKLLYENTRIEGVDWRERLEGFVSETERFFGLLEGVMPEIDWLDDGQTLTYLHACVSTRRHSVAVPEVPMHLDALLADEPLTGGLAPMLGSQHLRVVSVRGFPTSTWPGLLDDLNRLGFAYRWNTRFLCLDKAEAERELGVCAASGSPSARTSSRCCVRRSSSRKVRWSIPMRRTRRPMPMPLCRNWAAIRFRLATSRPPSPCSMPMRPPPTKSCTRWSGRSRAVAS